MDDMIGTIGLNFNNQVIPKEFEEAFRENYKNPWYEDVIGKQLVKEVLCGNFEEALKLLKNFSALPTFVEDSLFSAAHDANFTAYAFLLLLLSKAQSRSNLKKACEIAKTLNFIPGAYHAAAYHVRTFFFELSFLNPLSC